MTKQLIVINGFAQSGKSTAVNYLEYKGFYNASTSRVLGRLSEAIAASLFEQEIDTDDKLDFIKTHGATISSRELKIRVAEDCIVPVLSRKALMIGFETDIKINSKVVYEAFNQEEYDLFMELYGSYFSSQCVVRIRRDGELIGVDKRELIDCDVIIINDKAPSDVYKALDGCIL